MSSQFAVLCADVCFEVCVRAAEGLLSPRWVGVAHRGSKVVSMVIDVGHLRDDGWESMLAAKVVDQRQDESDCSHPDRKSKRTPKGGGGGMREKGAISQAKLLLGRQREKYHSNNSTKGCEEGRSGRRPRQRWGGREVLNKSSIIKVIRHECWNKQIEWHPYYPEHTNFPSLWEEFSQGLVRVWLRFSVGFIGLGLFLRAMPTVTRKYWLDCAMCSTAVQLIYFFFFCLPLLCSRVASTTVQCNDNISVTDRLNKCNAWNNINRAEHFCFVLSALRVSLLHFVSDPPYMCWCVGCMHTHWVFLSADTSVRGLNDAKRSAESTVPQCSLPHCT